jgi:hypothetical protein
MQIFIYGKAGKDRENDERAFEIPLQFKTAGIRPKPSLREAPYMLGISLC